MQKVMNFRDLGGIPTKDGRKVKKGLFFRSAMLDDATDEDIAFLKSLNIKHMFDYRDMDEVVLMEGNPYERIGVKRSHYPACLNNKKLLKIKKASFIKRFFEKVTIEDVKDTYTHLPFGNQGYKAMVKALVNGETPIYQHCTAGKDRTGLGSALLLAILGVGYDEILNDYLKSLEIKEYIQQRLSRYIPWFIRKRTLKRYEALFIVDKQLLDASYEAIIQKYQTFENYLLREYGLDEKTLIDLRNKYTE
ncbi:MAG TPA: tyrosine-protein phosphatase [Clostridiales bacterium]|nr:tyrosine-protein phosphatase [Clostridiales bacterium]